MFSYTVWNCSPMVRADSGINSLEELAGKRVMLLAAVVEPPVKFVDRPTRVASFGGILAAHPRVAEETAYQVTKAIFDNVDYVTARGSELQDVSLEFATKFLIPHYPVHPGAARYLKEKGVWRDDLTVAS
jgi:TRAP-type uncharacterized transport system substrate-binding protein